MSLVARHAALTDIGLHRSTNEDAFVAEPPLFAVADGMGGAQAGEVASHLALEALVEALAAGAEADDRADAGAGAGVEADADARGGADIRGDAGEGARVDLADAALAANASVYQRSRTDRSHTGMGTTLTAALLGDDRLEFAHVGDSRLYLWRDERLEQITDDHSLVGEMVRAGQLTSEAALTHPHRSILSRALGTEPRVEVDSGALELQAGDAVVLCSDGLYSMISEETFAAVLAAVDDPWRVARQLIREAKNEGGHDNITVIVLRFDEADAVATAVLPAVGDAATTGVLPALDTAAAGGEQLSLDQPGDDGEPAGAPDAPPSDEVAAAALPADDAEAAVAASDALPPADEAELAAAPPADEAEAATAAPPAAAAAAAPPRRHRRRRLWLVVALIALLAVCLVAGAVVADGVYYVGDHEGMVSVYRGLPLRVAGVDLNGLYLQTTTPLSSVAPGVLARIERHDLHTRAAALRLAGDAQGLP